MLFEVEVQRTSYAVYQIEATSMGEAEDKALVKAEEDYGSDAEYLSCSVEDVPSPI